MHPKIHLFFITCHILIEKEFLSVYMRSNIQIQHSFLYKHIDEKYSCQITMVLQIDFISYITHSIKLSWFTIEYLEYKKKWIQELFDLLEIIYVLKYRSESVLLHKNCLLWIICIKFQISTLPQQETKLLTWFTSLFSAYQKRWFEK